MTEKPEDPKFDPTDMDHPLYDAVRDPTHPFYEGDQADDEQTSDPSDDKSEYKVGPGRPPKKYTWKKGGASPNPAGRPKKVPSMKPDLKKALEDALNKEVPVKKGDKEVMLSRAVLGIEQLVNQFAKGDRDARRDVLQYAAVLGVDLKGKELVAEMLGPSDQAIVDAFLRRQQQQSPAPSDDAHVKAPPELLDDDAAKADGATPAALPEKAKKAPEPVLDENGNELPANDRRYVREMSRRYLEQQKKNQGGS